jgi:hypothetical protein
MFDDTAGTPMPAIFRIAESPRSITLLKSALPGKDSRFFRG